MLVVEGRGAYAHEAVVELGSGSDPASVGAAVTLALCGAVEHDGPCRWPHNNAIAPDGVTFRTLFIASAEDSDDVHARIAQALRSSAAWSVATSMPRAVRDDERALAARLAATPG